MSDNPVDINPGAKGGATPLLASATAAETRARRGLAVAITDFFLPDEARLDERTRTALALLLRALIDAVDGDLREHGAQLLASRGESRLAAAVLRTEAGVFERLFDSGLLRDPALMTELIARVRQDAIAAALPMNAPDDPRRPSLVNRFVQHPDRALASGAMAVLVAESRRRGADAAQLTYTDLPAELHHRLVWWVAAALRERIGDVTDGALPVLDRALSDAAQRSLGAYDEGGRLEAAAMRFAVAIDAPAEELPRLLVEALGDRRIVLFIALFAHGLGVGYPVAREIVLDSAADRLWLALRALDLSRETVARIGFALCEADPRRDVERFADRLDSILAVPVDDARAAIAPLRLDPDYRAALLALSGTRAAA
ncbi:DUF2336 domain-containing protein [Sphingomonas psychrotolerans]|uniref:DUF2336 domain-containing protein n=1 Tax=Sphingomonas psychrotolerans TaxID=1327635 RepID=A0ABU3MZ98_9SPHN|nr:DUF2336 domain-containing protein [Sphingomonas psychrotolerans]MDT8757618.1 DUF2336 domain-containing protein [Sphingomonas psychrotolerans]